MKIKLPKDIKRKWVNALRSGEYKQGKDRLHWKGEYCCLGVVAEVCFGISPKAMGNEILLSEMRSKHIPATFKTVLNQEASAAWGRINTLEGALTTMNDAKGWSFKKIASWIEKNL